MWTMILSLDPLVDELRPAFTQPSYGTSCELLLAWLMCLGKHGGNARFAARLKTHTPTVHTITPSVMAWTHLFTTSSSVLPGHPRAWLTASRFSSSHASSSSVSLPYSWMTLWLISGGNRSGVWAGSATPVASTKKRGRHVGGPDWVVLAVAVCATPHGRAILALAVAGPLALTGHRTTQLCRPDRMMLAGSVGLVARPTFYPGGRWWLTPQEFAGEPGRTRDVCGTTTWRRRVRPTRASGKGQRGARRRRVRVCPSRRRPRLNEWKRTTTGDWVWRDVEVTVYGCGHGRCRRSPTGECGHGAGLPCPSSGGGTRPVGRMRDCYLFTTDRRARACSRG